MPFTGIYADNEHVLGHELVHVFQYNIAEGTPGGGLMRLDALPLWLIEGMAEYFSLGREDPLTAMWMRDAVMRNKFPTIKQLTTDPRFFPYRYGQALWAYVGGRWGDRSIVDVYRTALRIGWDQALIRVLGENSDSLSKDWAAANRAMYLPQVAGREHPDSVGTKLIGLARSGDYNLAPTISPDGKLFAFFSSRNLFSIDLFVGDAATGKVIKKLGGPSSDPHFDAISFINSAGDWSPDGGEFAFIVYADGNNEIAILNTRTTNVDRRIKLPGIGSVSHVSWSPDGKTLVFSGQAGGISDLYLLDLEKGTIRQLTNDRYADIQPTWSPDGKTIAFATDRGSTDGLQHAQVLAAAACDVRCRDGPHQRVLAVREGQAHQPAVLARRHRPLLHLGPGRLPGRLPAEPRERPGLPHHERRDGRQRHHDGVACPLRSRARRVACCSARSTIRATRSAASMPRRRSARWCPRRRSRGTVPSSRRRR